MPRETSGSSEELLRRESQAKANKLMKLGVYTLALDFAPNIFRGDPLPNEPGDSNTFSISPDFRGDTDAHLIASLLRVRRELVTEEIVTVDWDGKVIAISGAQETFKGKIPTRIEDLRPAFSEAFSDPVIKIINDYQPPQITYLF